MIVITLSQKMMYKCLVLLTVLAVQQTVASTTSDSDGKSIFKTCEVLLLHRQQYPCKEYLMPCVIHMCT